MPSRTTHRRECLDRTRAHQGKTARSARTGTSRPSVSRLIRTRYGPFLLAISRRRDRRGQAERSGRLPQDARGPSSRQGAGEQVTVEVEAQKPTMAAAPERRRLRRAARHVRRRPTPRPVPASDVPLRRASAERPARPERPERTASALRCRAPAPSFGVGQRRRRASRRGPRAPQRRGDPDAPAPAAAAPRGVMRACRNRLPAPAARPRSLGRVALTRQHAAPARSDRAEVLSSPRAGAARQRPPQPTGKWPGKPPARGPRRRGHPPRPPGKTLRCA